MKVYDKIYILVFSLCTLLFSGCLSSPPPENNSKIKFSQTEYDFGDLELNEKAFAYFEFTNYGDAPLFIQNVTTSCGCTLPEWEFKLIKPNKKGIISVSYDTSSSGMFRKTITVFYNGQDSPKRLIIKGKVKYP